MRLDPARFNRLLADMGQGALWRPAMPCPCRDPYSGAADPACPVCQGRGTFWRPARRCHVALTGLKVAREWQAYGMHESGDVVLSLPSNSVAYAAGENDQVILTDSTQPWTMILTRGAADERVPAQVCSLEEAVAIRTGGPVTLALPAWPAEGGAPTWPAGAGPVPGEQYALRGRRHPSYFVFKDFPQDRAHHGGRDLPRRVVARRLELFARTTLP